MFFSVNRDLCDRFRRQKTFDPGSWAGGGTNGGMGNQKDCPAWICQSVQGAIANGAVQRGKPSLMV
jgi:hypothetical protein